MGAELADDWPQFAGGNRDNISAEKGLIRAFPEDGPKLLWDIEVGPGFGGAAVRDGKAYFLDRELAKRDILRCVDVVTGKEVWSSDYPAEGRLDFNGSRGVPHVGEEFIHTIGGLGQVTCFERKSGEIKWQVSIPERYEGSMPRWGWAQSPIMVDDLVIVAPLTGDVGLAALDEETGEEIWVTHGLSTSHSGPALLEISGEVQLVIITGKRRPNTGYITSFDPGSGEELWSTELYTNIIPIPTPTLIDDEHLFITGGYGAGSLMLGIEKKADGYELSEHWRMTEGSQIHQPILFEEHLYMLGNNNENSGRRNRQKGGLTCVDLDGKELWRTGDEPYMGKGNMILADGMLIILDGEDGTLRLVEPSPEGFKVLDKAEMFGTLRKNGRHNIWAPLALSNGLLVLRNQERMLCVDMRSVRD